MSTAEPLAAALADLDALEAAGLAAFRGRRHPRRSRRRGSSSWGRSRGSSRPRRSGSKAIPPADKKAYGQRFNAVKQALEAAWEAAKARVERPARRSRDALDVTLPGHAPEARPHATR